MKFHHASIPLVPRTTGNCLDLAILFFGYHLQPMLLIWAIFAGPCSAAVYYLSWVYEFDLRICLVILFFISAPLGVLVTCGATARAFGEEFTFSSVLHGTIANHPKMLVESLLMRLAIATGLGLCIVPGIWLALRYGFRVEGRCLSRLTGHSPDHRPNASEKQDLVDLAVRGAAIAAFCGCLWGILFFTVDIAASLLFGIPIFVQRIVDVFATDAQFLPDHLFYLIWNDPRVLTVVTGTGFLVWMVGRLAWLFCYFDARVRRDLWDIELQFLQENERIEARS